jgi:hypothetical protein
LRGTDVDQLSSRRSRRIALRLVKRLPNKSGISEEVTCSLVNAITAFFKGRFARPEFKPEQVDDGDELLKIASAYLDERAIEAFANALEEGYRSGPGES